MEEVFFLVEESVDGGYTAKSIGISIFTQAESLQELRALIKDAVACHFDDNKERTIHPAELIDEIIIMVLKTLLELNTHQN